ncbi:hypothetical protein D7Y27_08265 [Corallococcus sp. AB004]|uniref:hypothetical protein n=1 Tax=Corallococcus TaxID=83461 RepID=UPI000EA10983|nr:MULTISPECIES: hypothetical protein [Corallococcus]RKI46356.1 hypothetical protein D7Y27_08265 [Corallococcus sp. AB004]NPC73680.1 hypothetical protein [Corallococcus exiguus]NPD26306.1 hypothetical protein [Corallococcus exiguus]NRD46017.1 hypothetical protein [Corallococcus exiguus]RKH96188.1 hypothetical protein D7Y04_31275 [Corallococcus sp. AB038B]
MTNYSGTTGNGTAEHGDDAGFGQRVDQLGSDAQQFIDNARSAVADLGQTLDLKGRVERNPYGTLAIAVGVGYVLGGGLFTPLTGRILKLGVRLAALPFVKDELMGMAESAFQGYQTGRGPPPSGSV